MVTNALRLESLNDCQVSTYLVPTRARIPCTPAYLDACHEPQGQSRPVPVLPGASGSHSTCSGPFFHRCIGEYPVLGASETYAQTVGIVPLLHWVVPACTTFAQPLRSQPEFSPRPALRACIHKSEQRLRIMVHLLGWGKSLSVQSDHHHYADATYGHLGTHSRLHG